MLPHTNGLTNPQAAGAVPGTPGTPPTGWFIQATANDGFTPNGISTQIVGTGIDSGMSYIDIRFFGTATADGFFLAEFQTAMVPVVANQNWAMSCASRMVAGSVAGIQQSGALSVSWDEYDAPQTTNFRTTAAMNFVPQTSTWQTSSINGQIGANAVFADPYYYANLLNGAVINITLRFANPVFIQTDPAASVDRPCDNINQAYNAIRVKWLWNLAVPDLLTHTAGPFLPSTKVVRVTPSFGLYFLVTLTGAAGNRGGVVVGNGVYQDFYVDPSDSMNIVAVSGQAAGKYASILELA